MAVVISWAAGDRPHCIVEKFNAAVNAIIYFSDYFSAVTGASKYLRRHRAGVGGAAAPMVAVRRCWSG